ncbi:MAG: microviridin/marinostatin family tricyclic proteinase inhibitor [Flammeovirgaceae bacterium]
MKQSKQPFFTKFLEKQVKEEELKSAKGGAQSQTPAQTKKNWDVDVTMKWPSDNDDGPYPTW